MAGSVLTWVGVSMTARFNPVDWPIAWMARAERQHSRNATERLAHLGLHHREFRVLAMLANHEGLTVGELAELTVLERPTVSKMIDRMQREGWVVRVQDEQDKRLSRLMLTATGQQVFDPASQIVSDLFASYQHDMPQQERQQLMQLLIGFYRRVQEAGQSDHDQASESTFDPAVQGSG